ncbi:endonuclease/exonuclease/phosphatase family protein [Paenibacillus psychroresistens]|uniref:Endonuclease/exonuclease/phosphatase family protein n=1 Tax=Paenibacillus psychroresistens TaxID=1778678 RepID=A0A6B8RD78_9BACL|nr:endonuclease/exonuclease/phosphatase family protein [Paenibacillus psychroresistens]QGQ94169.1 endonuclease/exonuclease/phosphatase family protein [Paenibacillus psychroresistens]
MRIISWNCSQAFRKKWVRIAEMLPDIAVIQECESMEKLKKCYDPTFTNALWFGDNPNKGIGIFSNHLYKLSIHPSYENRFHWVVPVLVSGVETFTIFIVWTKDHSDKKQSYIGQLYLALRQYESIFQNETCIVIGDWNSNAIWDRLPHVGNHTTVVNLLNDHGLISVYHTHFNELHGSETIPTYYLHYNQNKGYHIDYAFIPSKWLDKLVDVSVGNYDLWRPVSDHVPLSLFLK